MLLRENSRGNKHGDLASIHDSFECGANSDLRFAEPDVAADEPIHGFGALHVRFGFDDGFHLVGGFFVNERTFEFALPGSIRREGVAGLRIARGLER
jgi:hypothetical protein